MSFLAAAIQLIPAVAGLFSHGSKNKGAGMSKEANDTFLKLAGQFMQHGAANPHLLPMYQQVLEAYRNRAGLGSGEEQPWRPDHESQNQIGAMDSELNAYRNENLPGITAAFRNGTFQRGHDPAALEQTIGQQRVKNIRDIVGGQYDRQGAALGQLQGAVGQEQNYETQNLQGAAGIAQAMAGQGQAMTQMGQMADQQKAGIASQIGTILADVFGGNTHAPSAVPAAGGGYMPKTPPVMPAQPLPYTPPVLPTAVDPDWRKKSMKRQGY